MGHWHIEQKHAPTINQFYRLVQYRMSLNEGVPGPIGWYREDERYKHKP